MSKKNSFFFKNLKRFKDKKALILENKKFVTYNDLLLSSIKISKKLSEKKKLVFLLGRNDLETITAYISFINKGHAVAFLDFRINNFFLNRLISLYKPSFIFYEKKRLYKSKLYNLCLNFKSYILYSSE